MDALAAAEVIVWVSLESELELDVWAATGFDVFANLDLKVWGETGQTFLLTIVLRLCLNRDFGFTRRSRLAFFRTLLYTFPPP
ncbi:hypothetical protein PCCS19_50770 [Paenibacillus sp. CCS19]|nr:hypothetical protein PCCS19_50770 [Paenibacillus cellulosilyticus]